jgi:SpoVK/Ycf46/Vps4 family AAA+-type ATPase
MKPGAVIPFSRLLPRADPTTRKRLESAVVAEIESVARSAPERRGKEVHVIFVGVSGTARTLAAQIFAQTIGMDLYRIDLGPVVSQYVGETVKNLDRVFAAAEHNEVVLFFDEADALFGRRSDGDASDRYANIETYDLLRRVERYAGPVILASKRVQDIDAAVVKRCARVLRIVEGK